MNAKVSFLVVTSLLATFGMVQPVQAAVTGATSDSSSSSSTDNSAASSSSSSSTATSQAPNVKGSTDVTVVLENALGDVAKHPWLPNDPNTSADKQAYNGAAPGSGLSLVYVTNKLAFGATNIAFGSETKVPIDEKNSGFWKVNDQPKFVVEVWDGRGTREGWHLNVKADPLMAGDKVIKGATINFGKPTLSALHGESNVTASVADINVEDKDQTLLNADYDNGTEWTTAQYDASNIGVTIPEKSAQKGTFTTKLTWDLVSGPVK
ncbi:WxL domain-containing protein [Lactiplantibacillus carotarum]|uniref:WxL domain-containing protein n=1 Tax=Lactiplantibacillus carotarum TaxID=2993456 RepID=UPI00298EDAFB|nr:WxL domain-containing protein [Lactiplantibacillus carotarum]